MFLRNWGISIRSGIFNLENEYLNNLISRKLRFKINNVISELKKLINNNWYHI